MNIEELIKCLKKPTAAIEYKVAEEDRIDLVANEVVIDIHGILPKEISETFNCQHKYEIENTNKYYCSELCLVDDDGRKGVVLRVLSIQIVELSDDWFKSLNEDLDVVRFDVKKDVADICGLMLNMKRSDGKRKNNDN